MILIKIGGGAAVRWDYIVQDLKLLIKKQKIILVHGANSRRDMVAKSLGKPTRYLTAPSGNSSVYTDKIALKILTMVYAGLVNKEIVSQCIQSGIKAVGLSGADGALWQAKRKKYLYMVDKGKIKLVTDTYTGKVEKVNKELIDILLKSGYLPILTQPAITAAGELVNTDNDRVLAIMAKAWEIEKIIFLFEAAGLLDKTDKQSRLVKKVSYKEIDYYLGLTEGRMKKKMLAVKEAMQNGVREIYFGDGRIHHPIISAMDGKGTIIKVQK